MHMISREEGVGSGGETEKLCGLSLYISLFSPNSLKSNKHISDLVWKPKLQAINLYILDQILLQRHNISQIFHISSVKVLKHCDFEPSQIIIKSASILSDIPRQLINFLSNYFMHQFEAINNIS